MSYDWVMLDPDSNNSPEYFKTEAEALAAASDAIQEYCDGEWHDGVENIIVARVTHRPTQIDLPFPEHIQEAIDSDPGYKPPFDHYCDYEMRGEVEREKELRP